MADVNRKQMLDRVAALLAGPYLLGRRALNLDWANAQGIPPERPAETPARLTVTPPEHAIQRRG